MKQAKVVVLVLVLIGGLYFAYQSFMTSFFPRRGVESLGRPQMSPEVQKKMAEVMSKKPKTEPEKGKENSATKSEQKPTEPNSKPTRP